jgi:hypothetical protein
MSQSRDQEDYSTAQNAEADTGEMRQHFPDDSPVAASTMSMRNKLHELIFVNGLIH